VLLQTIVSKWERSGSGRLMFHPEDDANYKSEEEIYHFEDGNDRKNFLSHANNRSYILYWWHIAYSHQLLTSARESLRSGVSVDSSQVPSTRSVSSYSRGNRLTDYQIQQLGMLESVSSGIKQLTQGMELAEKIKSLEECRKILEEKIEKLQEQVDLLALQALSGSNNESYTMQLDHQKVQKQAQILKLEEDLARVNEDIGYYQLHQMSRLGLNNQLTIPKAGTEDGQIPTSVTFRSTQKSPPQKRVWKERDTDVASNCASTSVQSFFTKSANNDEISVEDSDE